MLRSAGIVMTSLHVLSSSISYLAFGWPSSRGIGSASKLLRNTPKPTPVFKSAEWYWETYTGTVSLITFAKQNYYIDTKKPKRKRPIMTVDVVVIYLNIFDNNDMKLQNNIVFHIPKWGTIFPLTTLPNAKPIDPITTRIVRVSKNWPLLSQSNC